GRAGTILENWINELGLEEYAITNVVKCRPPDNRTPSQSEIERFGTWLEHELKALDPEIIIPLGKTATEFLLPETKERPFLDQVCYHEYENEHGRVLPMPHPAYALRSGHEPPFEQVNNMIEG
ncbi:MAG: uracil-DNA glycosylase, partial [Candidatus Nanohaloarchaea archaeon]|nr:uracil-DNA glycosylase [Candidatus Nanohaloarchaea archaeon]